MKIILCIINFGLILSLGSAQYNAFTVTRFPQLDTFLQNSVKLSGEQDTSSYNEMAPNDRKKLCKIVFMANIFIIDEGDEFKNELLKIKKEISNLINENHETQVSVAEVKYSGFTRDKNLLLCYSSSTTYFFIMADNSATTERYFLLFKSINDESTNIKSTLLGFAERTPNLTSLSTIDNELDEYYFSHRLNADLAVLSTAAYNFCTLFEDEAIRLCSLLFEHVIKISNTTPEIFIVTPKQPGDKNGDCHKIEIKLKTFRGVTYETSPILHCGVKEYRRGSEIPPIIFHIIPHLSNKTSVFLVEPIDTNKYKLTKHLESVSALDRENTPFRNQPKHVSRRFWWFS